MNKVFVSRRVEKKLRKGQVLLEEVDFQTYLKLIKKLNFSAKAMSF